MIMAGLQVGSVASPSPTSRHPRRLRAMPTCSAIRPSPSGNSIDPLGIIDQYSADALRFSLMQITSACTDVYVYLDKFDIGRNFGTKTPERRALHEHARPGPRSTWRHRPRRPPCLDPALLGDDAT